MKHTKIKISGNHVRELSENIPSNIFALNELIKNSYDACASYCHIKIDPKANQITVIDDGSGLGERSIEELFHISNSTKKFGHPKPCGKSIRLTQGSKGLGFLAAFRFGDKVAWHTFNNGKEYYFEADKRELIKLPDISEYVIDVSSRKSHNKGTTITIKSERKIIEDLLDYFSGPENNLKLVGAFTDPEFEIELALPQETVTTKSIPNLKDINSKDQLFYVTYDSKDGQIVFYRNGYIENKITHKLEPDEYDFTVELMIYSLESYGKNKITPYFIKPNVSSITPLIFINNNLFNNFDLFNTDLVRSQRSRYALPQIIGYVNINSSSSDFEFNSDRTNFVENSTTKKLSEDLRFLNEKIQIEGSRLKREAKSRGDRLTGPAYPVNGSTSHNQPLVRAKIELKTHIEEITVPSGQINLLDYVEVVTDSNGCSVPNSQLHVKINGKKSYNCILNSVVNPEKIVITYEFEDPNTNSVVSKLELFFKEKLASITGSSESKSLFFIIGSDVDYCIQVPGVAELMNQIAEAHQQHPKFSHLVACSLRTVFELSNNEITLKRPNILGGGANKQENNVRKVIDFIKNNKKIMTDVSGALSINYQSLNNRLDSLEFVRQFKKSNLGAHAGTKHLTMDEINDIAKLAGYYAAFCDALINSIDKKVIDDSIGA